MSNISNAKTAYDMRLAGADSFDIASALHITVDEAEALASAHSDSIPSPSNTDARRTEIQRVDVWLSRLNTEYTLQNIPIDKAVTSFCRLSERRCKLLGIDSPSRQEITELLNTLPPASIDAEVAALARELGYQ